jgi:hypothetical protein
MLLEKPKNKNCYFLIIGFFSGMLIGSKYTGPFFLMILMLSYFKNFIKFVNIKRLILFFIPFSIFGLSWYIRNLILTGSPVYPQSLLFFKGLSGWNSYLSIPMWKAFITTPKLMIDVLISELMIWPLFFLFIPIFILFVKRYKKNYNHQQLIKKFCLISFLIFLVYLFLPYDNLYLGMILSVRYIFNCFAILVLVVFLIIQYFKAEALFTTVLFSSYLTLLYQPYHPKLSFVYTPFVFVLAFLLIYRKKLTAKTVLFKTRKKK